ncbi:MAG: LysR substrate-binding domain-containing protein [Moraxella sp.]|nr:LysR substrate-binding domain-containing protein [Moraxella sp.]
MINPKNITLRQLWAFDAVARTQSFTQAADSLGMSQSSLSGLIKELENVLSCKLFDRTTRTLALSEAGKQIQPIVAKILHGVADITHEIEHLQDLSTGVVRVAASQQLAAAVLPQVIAEFEERYPNVQVLIEDCSVEQVLGMVNAGVVDFGIAPARDTGQGLVSEALLHLPFCIAMPSTHPLGHQTTVGWQALTGERLIVLGGAFTTLLAKELPPKSAALIQNASRRVNFMTTAFAMCRQGLGLVVCLPYSKDRAEQHGLVMRPLTDPIITRTAHLYRQSGRSQSIAARQFYGYLCRCLRLVSSAV